MWLIHEPEGATLRAAAYSVAMPRIGEAIASHGTREYFQGAQS
jgi:glutamate dehydrogenase (NADP+)